MSSDKIKEVKLRFNSLLPEQQTEDYFTKNWNKFKLSSPKAAKWFYNNHLKVNSVLACCCEETF